MAQTAPGQFAAQFAGLFAGLFARGHAVDIVLAVIAAEALWLWFAPRWRIADIAARLLPGALMLVALRAALTGAAWPLIALPLLASYPVHLLDLRRRPQR